jgi:hypothetical protein
MKRISASPIPPLAILGTRRGAPARAALAALGIAAIPCVFTGADRRPEPASAFARTPPSAAATTARTATPDDADADGVLDARENQVAARFAPVVVHYPDENAFPTSVDEFLKRTTLWLYDDACSPDLVVRFGAVTQASLVKAFGPTCGTADWIDSYGVRSRRKQHTFFLSDVDPGHRGGASDRRNWPTYVHSYPNDRGGLTLQYWRFYAYNDRLPYHGGDWEGLHVVLDGRDSIVEVALIGHTDIAVIGPDAFQWDSTAGGRHPIVGVQRGSHTTTATVPSTGLKHLTWQARMVNVGEKTRPLNGQLFLQYSGLWGSPGFFYESSGYWGPAFNETDLADDGFVVAWCRGMLNAGRELDGLRECYPTSDSR